MTTNNSNRMNHCYDIELALDHAKMEAEGVTNQKETKRVTEMTRLPEITTNNKENPVFNSNNCNIKTRDGHQCKRSLVSGCTLEVNDQLVRCCHQHWQKYLLVADKFIPVFHFTGEKAVNIIEEAFDAMDNKEKDMTRTIEIVTEELNTAKAQMKEFREHPYTTNAIAWGDAVGDRIDMLTEELKDLTNQKEETMKTDIGIFTINYHEKGMVKCINCSKTLPITDPENDWSRGAFHTIEDLRKCMGAPQPNIVASIWTGSSGDKMQTQRFTDKKLAIAWAKDVKGVFKSVGNGIYTVTWKLS